MAFQSFDITIPGSFRNQADLPDKVAFTDLERAADQADAVSPESKMELERELSRRDLSPRARGILEQYAGDTFGGGMMNASYAPPAVESVSDSGGKPSSNFEALRSLVKLSPNFEPFAPIEPVPPSDRGEFMKALIGGTVGGDPKMFGAAMQGLGTAARWDWLKEQGSALRKFGEEKSASYAPAVGSIADVRTDSVINALGDFFTKYLPYQAGNALSSMAPTIATGLLGAAAGGAVGGPGGAAVGGFGGVVLSGYPLNYGDIYSEATEDKGIQQAIKDGKLTDEDVARITAMAAVPITALDTWSLSKFGGALFKDAKKALYKRIFQEMYTGGLREGTTEGLQQILSEFTTKQLGSDKTLAQQAVAVADNAIGGMAGGVLTGGAAGAFQRSQAATPTVQPVQKPAPDPVQSILAVPSTGDLSADVAKVIDLAAEAVSAPIPTTATAIEPAPGLINGAIGPTYTVPDAELSDLIRTEAVDQKARLAEQQVAGLAPTQTEIDAGFQAAAATPAPARTPTAMEVAMQAAQASKAVQEAEAQAKVQREADAAAQAAERARQEAMKPQSTELPILEAINRRQPVADADQAIVTSKGLAVVRPDGTLRLTERGFKARNRLTRQEAQNAVPIQSTDAGSIQRSAGQGNEVQGPNVGQGNAQPQETPGTQAPVQGLDQLQNTLAPRTVAGEPVAAKTTPELQSLAASPGTPANTRHAAAAAIQARTAVEPVAPATPTAAAEITQPVPETPAVPTLMGKPITEASARVLKAALRGKKGVIAQAEIDRRAAEHGSGEPVKAAEVAPAQAAAPEAKQEPLKIPIVMGRNRLRGKGVGALVQDDLGTHLDSLRAALMKEAKAQGVEPTKEWTTNAVSQLLRMYETNLKEWEKSKGDTIGFVFEGALPSGRSVLMGEEAVLNRIGKNAGPFAAAPDLRAKLEALEKRFSQRTRMDAAAGYRTGLQPEALALSQQVEAVRKQIAEIERPAREAEAKRKEDERTAQINRNADERAKRVAALPVAMRRNGWEIVKDDIAYALLDPATKEEVYRGKLGRVKEVADESSPESVPEPAQPREEAKAREAVAPETESGKAANEFKAMADANRARIAALIGTHKIVSGGDNFVLADVNDSGVLYWNKLDKTGHPGKKQFVVDDLRMKDLPSRTVITPSEDAVIGENAAGEKLYERPDGSVYRMQQGRPNFGGDLAPALTPSETAIVETIVADAEDQVDTAKPLEEELDRVLGKESRDETETENGAPSGETEVRPEETGAPGGTAAVEAEPVAEATRAAESAGLTVLQPDVFATFAPWVGNRLKEAEAKGEIEILTAGVSREYALYSKGYRSSFDGDGSNRGQLLGESSSNDVVKVAMMYRDVDNIIAMTSAAKAEIDARRAELEAKGAADEAKEKAEQAHLEKTTEALRQYFDAVRQVELPKGIKKTVSVPSTQKGKMLELTGTEYDGLLLHKTEDRNEPYRVSDPKSGGLVARFTNLANAKDFIRGVIHANLPRTDLANMPATERSRWKELVKTHTFGGEAPMYFSGKASIPVYGKDAEARTRLIKQAAEKGMPLDERVESAIAKVDGGYALSATAEAIQYGRGDKGQAGDAVASLRHLAASTDKQDKAYAQRAADILVAMGEESAQPSAPEAAAPKETASAREEGRAAAMLGLPESANPYEKTRHTSSRIDELARDWLSGYGTAPKEAAKPSVAAAGQGEAPTINTEDAGAELAYNRRNRIRTGIKWEDIADKNETLRVSETTKQNVYPKPDYDALIADDVQPIVAHIVKQAYDSIAAKPNTRSAPTDVDLKTYIDGVNRVMAGVMAWAQDKDAVARWAQWQARTVGAMLGAPTSISELGNKAPALLEAVYPDGWKEHRAEIHIVGGNKVLRALQPGTDDARRAIKAVEAGWPTPQKAWEKSFVIEAKTVRNDDVPEAERTGEPQERFFIMQKAAKWRLAKGQADGGYASRDAAVEGAIALTKREGKTQISDKGISVESAERIGEARRMEGEDVSSDKLRDTFGFKGVNFGTWMKGDTNQAERQLHLNHAYDAFMDMADILGVPHKAMSLNGMLGVAVGAQGSGKYAAHFVPGLNEINLTRTSGAGSLAHEFGHAVDHYFATQAGIAKSRDPFLTEHVGDVDSEGYTKRAGVKEKAFGEGLRPEIAAAFKSIVDAMNTKQETPAQVQARLMAGQAKAAKAIIGWLASIKRDFMAQQVDAAKFDALAERIRNLDLGDGAVAAGNVNLSPVVDELRALYKEKTGRMYSLDQTKGLQSNIDRAAYLKSDKAADRAHVPQQVRTDYAEAAAALDKDKSGKKYWSTNLEKFARAFDAFVSDTLAEQAAKNTYLSHADRTGETVPTGEERTAINKALQTLVDAIETRETDKGVAMYSRVKQEGAGYVGQTSPEVQALNDKIADELNDPKWSNAYALAQPRTTRDALASAIERTFGKTVVLLQQTSPKFSGMAGMSYGGKIYVNTSIRNVGFVNIAGHELLHEIKRDTPDLYDWFAKQAESYFVQGAVERYGSKPEMAKASKDTDFHQEILADFTGDALADPAFLQTLAADSPSKFKQFLKTALEWFRSVASRLSKGGYGSSEYFTDVMAMRRHLAKVLTAYANRGDTALANIEPPQFSRSQDQTQTIYRGEAPGNIRFDPHGQGAGQFWTQDRRMAENFSRDGGTVLTATWKPTAKRLLLIDFLGKTGNTTHTEVNQRGLAELARVLGQSGRKVVSEVRAGVDTESALHAEDYAKLKAAGYDSVIGNNIEGTTEYVLNPQALNRDQTQTPDEAGANAPDWVKAQSAAMQETLRKAGAWKPQQTLQERIAGWTSDWQAKLKQGIVDQFDPIKSLDYHAYMLARMTKSAAGPLETMLFDGTVYLDKDGAVDVNYEKGGFIAKMQALKGEHDRFFAWVIGNRAERLMEEGKERNFTAEDISRLKTLNQDKMADGSSRAMVYAKALMDLNRYNKSIVDMAEKAGLIDPESRPFWEKDFYIPFYRMTEGDTTKGPVRSGGLVRQYAFKTLKGGEQAIGDPMENILKNWAHLIDASLKNQAAVASLTAAVNVGVAHETTADEKGAVFVMKDGVKTYYGVDDPFVLDAINSLGFSGFSGHAMKIMGSVKRWLTYGVTISPPFRIRNVIRDSLTMIGTNPASYNVLDNVLTGWKLTQEDSPSYASMIAGGGVIRFGTMEVESAANIKRLVASGVDAGTVLDSPAKVKAMLKGAYDWWMRIGDRSENVNRAALYQKLRDEGRSHLEASYAARDTMDFSMMGTWSAIRFLAQTVPFFNARLEGLYKLGRGAVEDPRRFAYVTGATALASIALLLAYKDDDDWKRREDWDRETYWWFKIGDKAFRIPKPFEIGAIGTLAERGLELMITDDLTGKQFAQRMGNVVGQQLSMNPVPQLFMPMIETWANRSVFTGRDIESQGMENLSKSERIGPNTSAFAQLAGKNGVVSPVQIDHLISGYFGWLGMHAVATADLALRPAMDLPGKPTMRIDELFTVGDFVKQMPAYQSKYVTRLYENGREVQEAMADLRAAQKIGATEKAAEILKEKGDKIRLYRLYTHAEKQLTQINQQIKMIQRREGDADAKREKLDQLYARRNRVARITEERAQATQQ